MTIQKLELLIVIALHAPASLYELAKRVEREFPAVLKDCTALEALGFIRIQQLKTGRKVKKPVLSFPYRSIAVYFPLKSLANLERSVATPVTEPRDLSGILKDFEMV